MADALKINGVDFPVASGSPTRTRVYVGSRGVRSFNGTPRSTERARVFEYKGRTPLLSAADSELYRALLEGDGHSLSFEEEFAGTFLGLATSRGLMPAAYTTTVGPLILGSGGTLAKWGDWYLYVDPTEGISWDLGEDYADAWTVLAWRRVAGVWRHCILTSAGTEYAEGVAGSASGSGGWAVEADGVFTLSVVNSVTDFDDVVFLPYVILAAWAPGLYTLHASQAFPALPFVHVGGRAVQKTAGVACLGEVGDFKQEDFGELLESADFTLRGLP